MVEEAKSGIFKVLNGWLCSHIFPIRCSMELEMTE